MRLGPSLGKVYRLGAEGLTQGGIGDIQTGRCSTYAAAERSETGKLNDLCSSLVFWFRSPDYLETQT